MSCVCFFIWRKSPQLATTSSFTRFLDRTQRHTTVCRTPVDEGSARRRDLYLTTHNTHNRQKSMLPVGFEPTISAGERPQTYALDRAATGSGITCTLHVRSVGVIITNITQHGMSNISHHTRGSQTASLTKIAVCWNVSLLFGILWRTFQSGFLPPLSACLKKCKLLEVNGCYPDWGFSVLFPQL